MADARELGKGTHRDLVMLAGGVGVKTVTRGQPQRRIRRRLHLACISAFLNVRGNAKMARFIEALGR